MKYIRTKDGEIIDLTSKEVSSYEIIDDRKALDVYGEDSGFICVYYFNIDIGQYIEYDKKGGRSMDSWYLKDILKQADTIEELCDCMVMVDTFHHITDFLKEDKYGLDRIISFESAFNGLKKHIGKVVNIYGAIWTDKGLIYVAKLNDKGELEYAYYG